MRDRLITLIDPKQIEPAAWEQIERALSQPWLKKLVVMPDVHTGHDLPIGCVALCDGVVSPSYVGYDIGCGVDLLDTGATPKQLGLDNEIGRRGVHLTLTKRIPMGAGGRHQCPRSARPFAPLNGRIPEVEEEVNRVARFQMGTLGGGNHFLEIGVRDSTGTVCITVHSGSRKAGYIICEYFMGLCSLWSDAPQTEQSYLEVGSDRGRGYSQALAWAKQYAKDNRNEILDVTRRVLGAGTDYNLLVTGKDHNHATLQEDGIVIHRKGATVAEKGVLGVIPGNMRDGVYIVEGLGNEEYLSSASHGAGRAMSRGQALRTLDMEEFKASMAGITADVNPALLDEAPGAYKPIADVIQAQDGVVVKVVDHVTPIINLKGGQ